MGNLPQILDNSDKELFAQELIKQGLTPQVIADKLKETLDATQTKIDKNGQIHESIDFNSRLKAIELWAKVMGITGGGNKSLHLHQHLSGSEIDELDRKAKETRRDS